MISKIDSGRAISQSAARAIDRLPVTSYTNEQNPSPVATQSVVEAVVVAVSMLTPET
jgi:hypothetical protein